ncbi:LADA_0D11804g1_1 [Lachancea dasiensis]|uniref:LADA_0D11804g1_1 n=1 Tax=Lachancea dasiensis TaxID=1072105 RepID=A0A1G4J804_9SACH|nr:LADA_0D11804g1_1 [Lachancea dasiensis]
MINELVAPEHPAGNSLKVQRQLSTTPRPLTPPLGSLAHRLVQSCKERDSLYRCVSTESLDSLQSSPEPIATEPAAAIASSGTARNVTKKYINQDTSPYGSRAQTPLCARPRACSTSFLRPRMEFTGFQTSGYKKNHVNVVLKTVSLPGHGSSNPGVPHITGFFSIYGLTAHQPEITTFFEGFAVTENLGFLSSSVPAHLADLTATDGIDLEHWLSFPAFKEMCSQNGVLSAVVDGAHRHSDYLHQRFIFMRWKERFLVPDAELGSVEGASYEGYYYIVHDQFTGNILGFYYHKDAEKFQELELAPTNHLGSGSCDFEFN